MSREGQYGDPTPRCSYCGKPKVSWLWSVRSPLVTRYYCSYTCAAKGQYEWNLACAGCTIPCTFIFLLVALTAAMPFDWSILWLLGPLVIISLGLIHSLVVGRGRD
jgi:hypothetical protein